MPPSIYILLSSAFISFLSLQVSATEWTQDFKATVENFPQSVPGNVNSTDFPIGWTLRSESRLTDDTKFVFKSFVQTEPSNASISEEFMWDFPELLVKSKFDSEWGTAILKVGQDVYSWGVMDVVNPLDFVNSRNYSDPIHPRKLGAGVLDCAFSSESIDFQILYIPWARSPELPGVNSRWLPRQVYTSTGSSGGYQLLLPSSPQYSYAGITSLDQANLNNLAAKINLRLLRSDLAFYYYNGISDVPLISPNVSGTLVQLYPLRTIQINSGINLVVQDFRQEIYGASFVVPWSSWQWKAQYSSIQPWGAAQSLKGNTQSWIGGIEKSWDVGLAANLTTVVEYSSNQHNSYSSNDLMSASHFFDNNWIIANRFSWLDRNSFTFAYSLDQIYWFSLEDLQFERRISDSLKWDLRATLLDGPSSAPLGSFINNKNISSDLIWSI
jgi:hypothetical protein